MAKVLGIGGIFFKSRDPEALGAWYERCLGFRVSDWGSCEFPAAQVPANAYSVWSPFSADTEYFAPSTQPFMVNLMVDDAAAVIARAVAQGAAQVGQLETHEYGTFGWILDPEGNKLEIWQPAG